MYKFNSISNEIRLCLRTVGSFLFGVLVGRNSTNNPIATKMQRNLHKILYLLPTTKTINASLYYNQQDFITIFRHMLYLFATLVHGVNNN